MRLKQGFRKKLSFCGVGRGSNEVKQAELLHS